MLKLGVLQRIQYAKGKSDTIAKLDGTYRMPGTAGHQTTATQLQQSIFGAPPSSLPAPVPAAATGTTGTVENGKMDVDGAEGSKGVKRGREEESDEEGAPMDEDSDAPMEASSDEDE